MDVADGAFETGFDLAFGIIIGGACAVVVIVLVAGFILWFIDQI